MKNYITKLKESDFFENFEDYKSKYKSVIEGAEVGEKLIVKLCGFQELNTIQFQFLMSIVQTCKAKGLVICIDYDSNDLNLLKEIYGVKYA